ncbi:MAG: hypothetical protein U9N01_04410 [Euryarchaeota archaeon]|nr:hypothetical protein [Euryarchaeota archaeon]
MKIKEKIYQLGMAAMDEMLLHRNVSKNTELSIEDSAILRNMIVHVGPHAIFTFDEAEIEEFYRLWRDQSRK